VEARAPFVLGIDLTRALAAPPCHTKFTPNRQ
jgi:hypothetical protein